jgi:hypothetical protein
MRWRLSWMHYERTHLDLVSGIGGFAIATGQVMSLEQEAEFDAVMRQRDALTRKLTAWMADAL